MDWVVDSLIEAVIAWLASIIVGVLSMLWDLLSATVFRSPDVTKLPQVTAFASTSLGVVNTCYVLAILWMAILVLGRDTIQARYGPSELIPRGVIGLIAANFAVPICSTLIEMANAVTAALTGQDITAPGSMQHLRNTTHSALDGQTGATAAGFLMLVIGAVIAVLVAILVVQWIIRLGLLVVVVAIAPVALALHGTPQTEGAAKLWWRTLLGTLGTVVIQAVALHTTLTIFLNPNSNLPVLGLPTHPDATMNLLIVLCLLWGIVKVPGLMRRYVTQTRPGMAAQFARIVVIQQVTQRIRRGLSPARGVRTVTPAAGPTPRPAARRPIP